MIDCVKKQDNIEAVGRARFKELFYFYPRAGTIFRKRTTAPGAKAGDKVGYPNKPGYLMTMVDGRNIYLHRLIFFMHHGRLPAGGQIDHINGDRSDNRVENLREVTNQENSRNAKRRVDNIAGAPGVHFNSNVGKYRARINVNGVRVDLGHFTYLRDAIAARKVAEAKYGYHKNHGRD